MLKIETLDTTCMGCFEQLESSDGVCPVCGYNEAEQVILPHQLRPRTILYGKYLLGKVLGEGGFGITYIGWDLNLDVKVAIKEYYPTGFVTRETASTNTVQPFTSSQGDFFTKGRERFVDEAKRLAKFRMMPGIVMVNDFFIENGTAYIAMEFVEGQTLKSKLAQMGGKLPAAQVFDMLRPVMTSLAKIHNSGMIHRDISPDNIMIDEEGNVKLLDFGAAREFGKSGNRSLSIMLKPGFAPEEQYRTRGVQGAWTDIYALCATIYRAITGVLPDEALDRMQEDTLQPPGALGVQITQKQENAILKGLAVHYKDRFQTVMELYEELYGEQQGTQYQTEHQNKSTSQPGMNRQGESASQPTTNHRADFISQSKRESKSESKSNHKPKTESDPELTPSRRSDDSDLQPPKDKKTNPIISWLAKNKVTVAIGSIVVVLLLIVVYQNVATHQDANSYMTGGLDTEGINYSDLTVGQRDVAFGDYTWRVLHIQDGKALLVSEKILEKRAYHSVGMDITWADCDLREYLNGSFLQTFTQEEQDVIIEVTNTNDDNQWYETEGGDATKDKIFLLSLEEVVTYFGDSGKLEYKPSNNPWDIADQYSEARKAKYEDNWSWWWLRSPGYFRDYAVGVNSSGNIYMRGDAVGNETAGVRPALWLDISDGRNSADGGNAQVSSDLTIGQRNIAFGDYTWRVLDIQDGKALLLSEEIVETYSYHDVGNITWEDSDIRAYLNGEFLQSFTQEEQDDIIKVTNVNDDNQWYGTEGGYPTRDRIFLLSIEEVVNYFGDSGQLDDRPSDDAFQITDQYSEARKAKDGNNWSLWWLRSPGNFGSKAACVFNNGEIRMNGVTANYSTGETAGVRPALWIDISGDGNSDAKTSQIPSNLTIGQQDVFWGDYRWRVLDIQDGKALLLSERVIELRAYHNAEMDVTWEDSDIRAYLNDEFIHSFTQTEQDAIIEVTNTNDDNLWNGTEGGEATKDKIFLLSIEEVVTYFGDSGQLDDRPPNDDGGITDQYDESRRAKNGNTLSSWWLRSPGYFRDYAVDVSGSGSIYMRGDAVGNEAVGVRPALWLDVSYVENSEDGAGSNTTGNNNITNNDT